MTQSTLKTFPFLQARIALMASVSALVLMETDEQQLEAHQRKVTELEARYQQLNEDNETLYATIDSETRDPTDDERKLLKANQAEMKGLLDDIEDRQSHIATIEARLQPAPRATDPDQAEQPAAEDEPEPRQARAALPRRLARSAPDGSRPVRVEFPRDGRELMGFKNAGHFLDDVKNAALGYRSDTLKTCVMHMGRRMDANATFGEDGAFAIPPDIANDVKKKIDASADLVGLCSRWNTASDRYTWFLDEDEPWNNTAGITGAWLDEGATIGESNPRLTKKTLDVFKFAIAVPATHEILRNASQLEQLIRMASPMKIAEELNRVILSGDGIGKPKGIFNSNLAAVQAKVVGQTAATVVRQNVVGAHNLVHPTCRSSPGFRWIANLDVEPQLDEMVSADNRPLYLPAQSLATAPHDTLRGRPIVYSPHAKALGQPGDLAAIDFSKYMIVFGENLRADFSMHVRFLQDKGVFRFIIHVGGEPMWGKKISEPNTAVQRSFASVIAQRA